MRHLLIVLGDQLDASSAIFDSFVSRRTVWGWRRHLERRDPDRLMAIRRQADQLRDRFAR